MKVVRFSVEVKYRTPNKYFPSWWFDKSIECSIKSKYSDIEFIQNNADYKKYNESIWRKIKQESIKKLYKEEQLIASYDKRKINYFIFSNDLGRKYKKETSFDILIISRKNRNIDLVVNQVMAHIRRKLWFMSVDIIKDSGANIYFEKKLEEKVELKSVTADIIENDKTTLVEKISAFGLFLVGSICTYIGLNLPEGDLKTITLSIGTSELAVILGVMLTYIAKLWNKDIKISIIDVGSFVEDENIITSNESPFDPDEDIYRNLENPNMDKYEKDEEVDLKNKNNELDEQEIDLKNPIPSN